MKKSKIARRKMHLETMVINGDPPFCKKHKREVTIKDVYYRRCYIGNRGTKYCKYLEIR